MSDIEVTVNGDTETVAASSTIADVVASRVASPRGVAVACNLEMIPRSLWAETPVATGDDIEVLTAAQGG